MHAAFSKNDQNSTAHTNHPVFRWLKKYMGKKVKESCDIDPEDIENASKGKEPTKDKDDL